MAWGRGQALGRDLRDRVLADAGRPARAVAARFGVSVSYVVKARARLRDAGEASARPQRNHVPPRPGSSRTTMRSAPRWPSAPARGPPSCAPGWRGRTAPWSATRRCGAPSTGSA